MFTIGLFCLKQQSWLSALKRQSRMVNLVEGPVYWHLAGKFTLVINCWHGSLSGEEDTRSKVYSYVFQDQVKFNIDWFPLNGWMFCMKLITYYLTWQIVVSTVMTEKQYKTVVVAYSSDSYSLGPDLTKSCYLNIKQLFIGEANKYARPCFT